MPSPAAGSGGARKPDQGQVRGQSRTDADGTSTATTSKGSLRQRFKKEVDHLGKEVEEFSVKLKRRDDGHYKLLAPGTPFDEIDLSESKFFRHIDHEPVSRSKAWSQWIFGRKFFFPMGVLFGVLVAVVMMKDMTELPNDLAEIWATMPGTLDPRELLSNLTIVADARRALESRDFTVGESVASQHGLWKHHPIILVPGIVSTGLESWGVEPPARGFFRKRLWGTSTMIRAVVTNKERWLQALSIDPETGLDPPGYKVRAAQGLDAASEFIQGYWVWQKIVENLAVLGYDTNSMDMAAYDWRLAYYNLEVRDYYFSRLKSRVELFKKQNKQKVVLCSHSMGGTVILYFLKWVEADPAIDGFGGGGGPQWVDEHIESWINVAGTLLGVSKAMTAFLSGEMRDTVEIHPAGSWVLEKVGDSSEATSRAQLIDQFFSRKERAKLFRRWPGASSMWIKGGNRIWGEEDGAPDDPHNATDSHGRFFSFRHMDVTSNEHNLTESSVSPNLTIDEASRYVLTHTPSNFQRMMETNYSYGFESDPEQLAKNNGDHRKWTNPLEVQLPNAPSMKIYCLYGHGKETERSYWYVQGEYEQDESRSDAENDEAFCDASDPTNNCDNSTYPRTPLDFPLARKQWIDAEVTVKGSIPEVRSGVKFGDGDGTIPVISLGSMCVKGWKGKTKWNPAGIEVITQEYKHSPESLDLRGGALTADHVDILGSTPLNEAILKVAAGRGDLVKPHIGSRILEWVEKMRWD